MMVSNEIINAYADGELQGSEEKEFEHALEGDEELQQTLDSFYLLKAQLKQCYQQVRPAQSSRAVLPVPSDMRYAVYGLLLMLTFVTGWFSAGLYQVSPVSVLQAVINDTQGQIANVKEGKYILHISLHDEQKFTQTLDQVDALLTRYADLEQGVELEVIANSGGLALFRDDGSVNAKRVKYLNDRYPSVKFLACSNAIERLREKGGEPNLITAVHQDVTAIDQVVRRVHDGWSYIKI